MYIDLTLDGFRLPGIKNFEPQFGIKEVDGAGLTTRAIVDDMMMPFLKQRAIVINEPSTTTEVRHNTVIALQNGNVKLVLGDAGFVGCKVRVIGIMPDGTGYVEYKDASGNKATYDVAKDTEVTFMGNANRGWILLSSLPVVPEPPEPPKRPIIVSENTTVGEVQEDNTIVLTDKDIELTLDDSEYVGCRISVIGGMATGTSVVKYKDVSSVADTTTPSSAADGGAQPDEIVLQTSSIAPKSEVVFIGGESGSWFILE